MATRPTRIDAQVGVETKKEGRNEKERLPRRRCVHHVRAADQETTIEDKTSTAVTAEVLKKAQLALFFLCQAEFREDLDKCRSTFVKLAPVRDAKGMIRAKGHLGKLPLQPEVRHPIILPGNNPLVELFARRKHIRYLHQGYRIVLANIAKEEVHIGNGKELLKYVASKCVYCCTRRESILQQ